MPDQRGYAANPSGLDIMFSPLHEKPQHKLTECLRSALMAVMNVDLLRLLTFGTDDTDGRDVWF